MLLAIAACSDSPTSPVDRGTRLDLSDPLEPASLTALGIDRSALDAALDRAETTVGLQSLIVVRHGRLAAEHYFNGGRRDSLVHVRSVTKSVVSILVGIALRERLLDDIDQPIGDLLPERYRDIDAAKRAIRLRHLLTMTSGFEWHEAGAVGYNQWVTSADPIRYLLDRPLATIPGSAFLYNSAATHLLSVILTETVGENTLAFADRWLFGPLGITQRGWGTFADGYPNGGADLRIRPLDLAKIGVLFLQDGYSGESAVVPTAWVRESSFAHVPLRGTNGVLTPIDYGLLWWIAPGESPPAFYAHGYGGQFLFIVPDRALVIVATADWRGLTNESQQALQILDLIAHHVAPAAR